MAEPNIQVLLRRPYRRRRSLIERFFMALILIIALLIVINGAILLIKRLQLPAKPAAGDLLYATTFDDFNDQWTQYQGQDVAEITGGMLKITVNSTTGLFSPLDHEFSDFDLHVDTMRLAASDDQNESGVMFRYQDVRHYYMFSIRGDGAYRVELCNDCDSTHPDTLSEWQISPAILTQLTQVNQIRIVAKDDHFKFYVNGQPLILCLKGTDRHSTWNGLTSGQCLSNNKQTSDELVDSTFASGKIALSVTTDTPNVQVGFDNLLIYGPQ